MPQIPPITKGPQALNIDWDIINADIRAALRVLNQLITTQAQVLTNHVDSQANLGVGTQPNEGTPTSRICDYMRMNSCTFYGTKVDEDPHGFIVEVFKVVDDLCVNPRERMELAAYKHKDVSQVWFEQWKHERHSEEGPID